MADPLGFFLLSGIAVLGLSVGAVGLRRGKTVALFESIRFSRREQPIRFWYGIFFQLGIGFVSLGLAVVKLLE